MVSKVSAESFRSAFKAIHKDVLRWFPGHMGRGLKDMQHKLSSVDCVVEVHDARIPISGRNMDFKYTISGVKPHILVLNKVDLIERSCVDRVRQHMKKEYENIVFTNCKDQKCKGVQGLFPLAQELINKSDRYNRSDNEDYNIMIIGVTNVGKSSLVNALRVRYLRKGNATSVGASPGITRSVLHKIKMCEKPLFYMIDTPGILSPNIVNIETGLKLAICACIQDHLVGETIIADYLLYWLNRHEHFEYVKMFELDKPVDNIIELLTCISTKHKKMLKIRDNLNNYVYRPNLDYAAQFMLKAFRRGKLGRIMLDEDIIK